MSKDQDKSSTRYYIKLLDRKGTGAPNWVIYKKRLSRGSIAVCLCYTEEVARDLLRLLEEAERTGTR
jgi:hypothetical protein